MQFPVGDIGATGARGVPGNDGQTGVPGTDGRTGATGASGEQGWIERLECNVRIELHVTRMFLSLKVRPVLLVQLARLGLLVALEQPVSLDALGLLERKVELERLAWTETTDLLVTLAQRAPKAQPVPLVRQESVRSRNSCNFLNEVLRVMHAYRLHVYLFAFI